VLPPPGPDPLPPSNPRPPIGAIIGGTIGGIIACVLLFLFLWRRRRRQHQTTGSRSRPFVPEAIPLTSSSSGPLSTSSGRSAIKRAALPALPKDKDGEPSSETASSSASGPSRSSRRSPNREAFVRNLLNEVAVLRQQVRVLDDAPPPRYEDV
jgi:uncharacterized SAM-binding protein YcdF (DUF218 family)